MLKRLAVLVLLAVAAHAAATRLYLKDGSYHLIREYEVKDDRVRYYSSERGDWEEIPLDLVDLKRTRAESESREQAEKEDAAQQAAEEKAERAIRKEIESVPVEPGVYYVAGANQLKTIPEAQTKIVNDKKRTVLKVLSPLPIVAGKGTLEIDGPKSANVVDSATPEFYIRLAREERFGMVKLAEHKGNRVVEEIQIIPVTKEIAEKQDEVATFRRQAGDSLYKIWPKAPLEPGEYAIVEFSPAEDRPMLSIMTWDFSWPGKR